jgi:hypothetical protein
MERENFRRHIAGDEKNADEFDLTINLARMKVSDVINLICFAAQAKGMVETTKSKVEVF